LVRGPRAGIRARWRLGLCGYYERADGYPYSGFAISLRGLSIWLLGLGVVTWIGGSAILTSWFGRMPHNNIRFVDVLFWPARRPQVTEQQGRMWIAQGRDAIAVRHNYEALLLLRRGLDRAPGDYEARATLVEFYLLTDRRPQAMAVLADAMKHGLPSAQWFEKTLATTQAGEDWETTRQICRAARQLTPNPKLGHGLLACEVAALTALGRAEEALRLAENAGETRSLTLELQHARVLLALNRANEAAEKLARWRTTAETPADEVALLAGEVEALRAAGRFHAMNAALDDLSTHHRLDPTVGLFVLEQQVRSGQGDNALEHYLLYYGHTTANLLSAAKTLAQLANPDLVKKIVMAAHDRGYDAVPIEAQLALSFLRKGDTSKFDAMLDTLESHVTTSRDVETRALFDWMRSLSVTLKSEGRNHADQLVETLRKYPNAFELHRLSVVSLRSAHRLAAAQTVLHAARERFVESPSLRAEEVELARLAQVGSAPDPASNHPSLVLESER
jgi:hypothetical protein